MIKTFHLFAPAGHVRRRADYIIKLLVNVNFTFHIFISYCRMIYFVAYKLWAFAWVLKILNFEVVCILKGECKMVLSSSLFNIKGRRGAVGCMSDI